MCYEVRRDVDEKYTRSLTDIQDMQSPLQGLTISKDRLTKKILWLKYFLKLNDLIDKPGSLHKKWSLKFRNKKYFNYVVNENVFIILEILNEKCRSKKIKYLVYNYICYKVEREVLKYEIYH